MGIYGKSGVGKSVLIKHLIFGKGKNTSGELLLDRRFPEAYVNNEVAYYPQFVELPELLTCREFLSLANADRGNSESYLQKQMENILSQCALNKNILGKRIGNLSGGEKRRLGLAATLLETHLRILIADEPTTGMDPNAEQLVMETLRNISKSGVTVLTITHSVTSASFMDKILVLYKEKESVGSRLIYDGEPPKTSMPHLNIIDFINGKAAKEQPSLYDRMENIEEPLERSQKSQSNHREDKGCLRQIIQWFLASLKLIYRDWKSLLTFVLLAIVCLLAIQIGTYSYHGNNTENTLLTLCSLAAPWLCAMFAAVFLAEFRQFYSWEAISGLKPHSFFFGTLLAQLLPSVIISIIFTLGLFLAPRTNMIARRLCGKLFCSQYTYDITVRTKPYGIPNKEALEGQLLSEYLKQKDLEEQLKIVKSLYDSNQKTLLEKALNQINPFESQALVSEIRRQCPGVILKNDTLKVKFTRIDSLSHKIPWFKREGKTQHIDGEEYVEDEDVLPFKAEIIVQIYDKIDKGDQLKEAVEYLYWYHNKKLLNCLLDYVSLHDITGWKESVKDCPGIVVNPAGQIPYYTLKSWKGTPCFPNIYRLLGKGKTIVAKDNTLPGSIINFENNHSLIWNPVKKLFEDISKGDNNNYPLADEMKTEPSPIQVAVFFKVLLIVWGISMIGSVLGMTGTACFGSSREATVFVLVLFVVFIIFSRLFITQPSHVSYLQPIAENMKALQGIRQGDSCILLPIAISFLCLGRYASNLIAYSFSHANLTYEYLYMALLFCICLLFSLISLRKGKFSIYK